jgi:hypothetical protein
MGNADLNDIKKICRMSSQQLWQPNILIYLGVLYLVHGRKQTSYVSVILLLSIKKKGKVVPVLNQLSTTP